MIRQVKLSVELVKIMNFEHTPAFSILQHIYSIMRKILGATLFFLLLGAIFNNLNSVIPVLLRKRNYAALIHSSGCHFIGYQILKLFDIY